MLNKESSKEASFSSQLLFPATFSQNDKEYFQKIYQKLPVMKKNQLNIIGVKLEVSEFDHIKVSAVIRSTLEKKITMQPQKIILLDKNLDPIAEREVTFTEINPLSPNTSKILTIVFSKIHFKNAIHYPLEHWSLAFAKNIEHRVDLSDFNAHLLSKSTKKFLTNLVQNELLEKNELSFLSFSAKQDNARNLHVHLLLRNGTRDDLKVKQLSLHFYDATEELIARGVFTFDQLTVQANTSKPIALVFPASSIEKDHLDLSKWSLLHESFMRN